MKNTSITVMILIFISLNAGGQQSQDTLYLKNGDIAVGTLLGQSKTECRFRSADGILFTFLPDEVERIVTTPKMIMRKVNPDTLNAAQLNLYLDKAVKMRNAGRVVTLGGLGAAGAGLIIAFTIPWDGWTGVDVMGYSIIFGITTTVIGVPLWLTGNSRKTKAELTVQKFNIAPQGSMALGLGMTIWF